jgi:hypothetical protein
MDIKDFIKSTVTQISEAVKELNDELSNNGEGTIVNPYNARDSKRPTSSTSGANITDIAFDLNVVVESGTETSGKVGVFSSIVGVGISGKEGDLNKIINRIQFTIPVLLPFEKSIY